MAKSATLAIRIVSDASGASKGFAEAESKVGGFQRGLDKASMAATGVLGAVGLMAKAAFDSASELEQASGAMAATFGKDTAAMEARAKAAASTVGLANSEYASLASVLGSQLKNMGVEAAKLGPQTDDLVKMGADLAAQFGGSTSEAVSALSSLLRGERDPIERYGVSISQAGLDAKMAALGLDTSSEAAKKNSQLQATLALLTEQTASAQGAFARESDTAAGAQQRASAQFENAKAALGQSLLPIVAEASTKFSELATWVSENTDTVIPFVAVLATLAAGVLAVNAAVSAYRAITVVATAIQWLFNAALYASGIPLIVLAVAALVAGVIIAYQKFDTFRGIVDAVGRALKAAFEGAKTAIAWVVDKVKWLLEHSPAGLVAKAVGLLGAPAPAAGGGQVAGLYGAASGLAAGLYGAPSVSLAGGGSTAGQGLLAGGGGMTVNVTINGAVDPVATGRQVQGVLTQYGSATGRDVTMRMGRS